MKSKRRLTLVIAAGVVLLLLLFNICNMRVDPSYASSARVTFHYCGKRIDTVITNKDDVEALKRILRGRCYWENGDEGCGSNVSVTLFSGIRSITFCPDCDGCPEFRIGCSVLGEGKFLSVSEKQRKEFDAIVKKYGMTFPCI